MPRELTHGCVVHCSRWGSDEIRDRFRLQEIQLSVEQRALRELAGKGMASAGGEQRRECERGTDLSAMQRELDHVLARIRAWRVKDRHDSTVNVAMALRVSHRREIRGAGWGRSPGSKQLAGNSVRLWSGKTNDSESTSSSRRALCDDGVRGSGENGAHFSTLCIVSVSPGSRISTSDARLWDGTSVRNTRIASCGPEVMCLNVPQ